MTNQPKSMQYEFQSQPPVAGMVDMASVVLKIVSGTTCWQKQTIADSTKSQGNRP